MAGNSLTLEFAGDATKLQRASKQAQQATDDVAAAARNAGDDLSRAAQESATFTDRVGQLGAGVTGMTDAIDSAGAAVQGLADLQQAGVERASRLARAANDVKQATEDMAQAQRDASQATIDSEQAEVDLEQARLDQATALKDYNAAVKEHGANSDEAKQAQIDLAQAGVDVKQAEEDAAQAIRDASQATIDGEAAQLDLNDAMREANPTGLQEWADKLNMLSPILTAVVGVVGLVTAAQWAWNAAQYANPIVLIIAAVIALIAVIVLIATKTDWFQRAWRASWGFIKDAAAAVGSWFKDTLWGKWIKGAWDSIVGAAKGAVSWYLSIPGKIKDAFLKVTSFLFAPFRAAFNLISDAWNSTIGSLSWSVPGWIPGIGGNTISVPNLPKFHQGGTVPGPPGSEMLAILEGGETVRPAGGGDSITVIVKLDSDVLIEAVGTGVRRRGGNVQFVLGASGAR
jgi:hypothetical protein